MLPFGLTRLNHRLPRTCLYWILAWLFGIQLFAFGHTLYLLLNGPGRDSWQQIDHRVIPILGQLGGMLGVGLLVIQYRARLWAATMTGRAALKQSEAALRQSEARNRAILEAIPDLILRVNRQGDCLDFIPPSTIQNPDDFVLIHHHLSELLAPDLLQRQLAAVEQALTTGELQIYEHQVVKHGAIAHEEVRISAVNNSEVLIIVRDISQRKRTEQLLADYNRTLEQQVSDRTLALEQEIQERKRAEAAAQAASQAKSTFLANMSHELRTPLNAILGFSHLMQQDPNLLAEQQNNLGIIRRSGEYLLTLINQVLDLSKIEAGQMLLNPVVFDLPSLLQELEAMFSLPASKKGLIFNVHCDLTSATAIYADVVKLRQVLINLVGNAIKFTQQGQVTLRVTGMLAGPPVASSPLTLAFEVTDTGVGIAPHEIDRIFDAFVQASAGQQSQEGTGLGLTISRQFIELMGGSLMVISQGKVFDPSAPVPLAKLAIADCSPPMGGTSFRFQIPVILSGEEEQVRSLLPRSIQSLAAKPALAAAASSLTPEDLYSLPAVWVFQFRQAIIEGDLKKIQAALTQIQPDHLPLARVLLTLVQEYEFEYLLSLMDTFPASV